MGIEVRDAADHLLVIEHVIGDQPKVYKVPKGKPIDVAIEGMPPAVRKAVSSATAGANHVRNVRKAKQEGWGDKIEKQLQSLGITPEKYVAIKEKFGLPPTCYCKGRKAWLNKVGEYFS